MPQNTQRHIHFRNILDKIGNRRFHKEEKFKNFIIPELKNLFKFDENQFECEVALGGRSCDIAIYNSTNKEILLIIELKIKRVLDDHRYPNHTLSRGKEQLEGYCKFARASYGIVLSETMCFVHRYNWWLKKFKLPYKEEIFEIPDIKTIERERKRNRRNLILGIFLFFAIPLGIVFSFITDFHIK